MTLRFPGRGGAGLLRTQTVDNKQYESYNNEKVQHPQQFLGMVLLRGGSGDLSADS